MITIGIVDNDRFALALLAQTVGRAVPGGRVLWAVESGAGALHRCLYGGDTCPDVLLLDVSLTDMDGLTVCRRIRESSARPAVLCITSYDVGHYRETAIDAGAQGLISKSCRPRDLASAIGTVADGRAMESGFMDAAVAHERVAAAAAERSRTMLSERERQVLDGYANNLDTEEIAALLGIRASTVFVVVRHAKAKLGVATRAEAVRAYLAGSRADSVH
ncbi:response regulator transcription factor [Bifidobacterium samirii]|uniref:Two-component response regulator n=1 Tax=Bifidobacterium samirii TaxID=2306974 RepID=A0A430FNS6_9BIFI|nr:response regulator transcription factor [Bifidobacterium samirii]RSX54490.1 two-component response regulator [Bifidobacterium samirii]